MIRLCILGSTGSVGRSTLEVVARHPDRFRVVTLAANRRADDLEAQVQKFKPEKAILCEGDISLRPDTVGTKWVVGREALLEVVADQDIDVVVNALVGAAGLEPTIRALEAGTRLALANKESLVAGGALVLEAAERGGAEIIPIDSEHSAIMQCCQGYPGASVNRVVLTASGGAFRGMSLEDLWDVRPEDALRHPTWDMGAKITVDSATLANKALEVIEAHYLYGLDYDQIEAVVHPQSVIHSFVEFVDGSVLAQLGFPTMELPILYALSYPERVDDFELRTYDPVSASPLTFEDIDHTAFPLFGLGTEAGRRGGAAPAAFNASNEVAVRAFLDGQIRMPEIAEVVFEALEKVGSYGVGGLDDVLSSDADARAVAGEASRRMSQARIGVTS